VEALIQAIVAATTAGSLAWVESTTDHFEVGLSPYRLELVNVPGDMVVLRVCQRQPITKYVCAADSDEYEALVGLLDTIRAEDTPEKHVARIVSLLGGA